MFLCGLQLRDPPVSPSQALGLKCDQCAFISFMKILDFRMVHSPQPLRSVIFLVLKLYVTAFESPEILLRLLFAHSNRKPEICDVPRVQDTVFWSLDYILNNKSTGYFMVLMSPLL